MPAARMERVGLNVAAPSAPSAAGSCTWFVCGFVAALVLVQLVTRAHRPELPQSPPPQPLPQLRRTQPSRAAGETARAEAAAPLILPDAGSKGRRRGGIVRDSDSRDRPTPLPPPPPPPPPPPLPPPPPAAASVEVATEAGAAATELNVALCRRHPKLAGCAGKASRSVVCKRHPKAAGCAGRMGDDGSGPRQTVAQPTAESSAEGGAAVRPGSLEPAVNQTADLCVRHPRMAGCTANPAVAC